MCHGNPSHPCTWVNFVPFRILILHCFNVADSYVKVSQIIINTYVYVCMVIILLSCFA